MVFYMLVIESSPYAVDENGWGEFQIQIRIHFVSTSIRPLFLTHQLKLYPDDGTSASEVVSERWDKICIPSELQSEFPSTAASLSSLDLEGI